MHSARQLNLQFFKGFHFFLVSFVVLGLSSCITPPPLIEPIIVDSREFSVVSNIRRSKEMVANGRIDEAEFSLREAYALSPDSAVILNDLGYVLMLQNRLGEAQTLLLQALALAPHLLTARDHFSRLLYRQGRLIEANESIEIFIDEFFQLSERERNAVGLDLKKLWENYANLAQSNYSLGFVDEAACLGRELALSSNVAEYAGWYVKLLLANGMPERAAAFAEQRFTARGEGLPVWLMADQMVAYWLSGRVDEAKFISQIIVDLKQATTRDQLFAWAFLNAASSERPLVSGKKRLREDILRPLCREKIGSDIDFHPSIIDAVEQFKEDYCDVRR
ncbi:MAG: tetratricopeptide repeat protein [bacterium]|nr:tetratricopeptide repeat protein [bacterium]